jgi:NADH-quinone oxidoreductase subunit M
MMGILVTGAALVVVLAMLPGYNFSQTTGLQYQLNVPWITAIGARYHVGIDGISLPMFVLTYALSFLCAIYTWKYVPSPGKTKAFVALILLLETGMAGTFISFDLILFFIFWELVLVPMYFLIGIWGSANRAYASIKFFLYTLFGSVFMLLGFLAMYFSSPGAHTFDIQVLTQFAAHGAGFSQGLQMVVFAAVFLGFAIKVPMWPFHTWLPDAHTEAPTVGSVLLAGIMLKMGTYGFIRIALPILPGAARVWAPWIGLLAAIAIVYAALACLAQKDLKRLIAFSSVGHMGFVMLGIATLTTIGINAAIFGMVAHGIITGMLFFCVGSIYDRYHTRQISEIGGGLMALTIIALATTLVVKNNDAKTDLLHAALLIAKLDNEELDIEAYRNDLERMAKKIAAKLPKDADNKAKRIHEIARVALEDQAVDQALERLRQRAARYEPVEGRPVEAGDTTVVDLVRESSGLAVRCESAGER